MRHQDDNGLAILELLDGILKSDFTFTVEIGARLVKQYEEGLPVQGARQSNPLPLSDRQRLAAVTYRRVVAARQTQNHVVRPRGLRRAKHSGAVGRGGHSGDVFRHRAGKQFDDLRQIADVASETVDVPLVEGGTVQAFPLDISSAASCEALVASTLSRWGRVDVLANFAGISPKGEVLSVADEVWHQTLAVNLTGSFYLTRAVARPMVAQGGGTMILIASDRGIYGKKNGAHFAASKAGIVGYAKSLALELGKHNVTVNALNPGTTDTPHIHESTSAEIIASRLAYDPLGKLSTPENIAEIILFLAGPGGEFITGQLFTTRMRAG